MHVCQDTMHPVINACSRLRVFRAEQSTCSCSSNLTSISESRTMRSPGSWRGFWLPVCSPSFGKLPVPSIFDKSANCNDFCALCSAGFVRTDKNSKNRIERLQELPTVCFSVPGGLSLFARQTTTDLSCAASGPLFGGSAQWVCFTLKLLVFTTHSHKNQTLKRRAEFQNWSQLESVQTPLQIPLLRRTAVHCSSDGALSVQHISPNHTYT